MKTVFEGRYPTSGDYDRVIEDAQVMSDLGEVTLVEPDDLEHAALSVFSLLGEATRCINARDPLWVVTSDLRRLMAQAAGLLVTNWTHLTCNRNRRVQFHRDSNTVGDSVLYVIGERSTPLVFPELRVGLRLDRNYIAAVNLRQIHGVEYEQGEDWISFVAYEREDWE